ncbi:MAG: asparagine synthase (glutamine-hydrolyzing) [Candidatus Omnitrophota bacterium]|jgi:asparagine synthase (glutamine-hydrolysing)
MCGIAGILDLRVSQKASSLEGSIKRMSLTLRHRGPDDEGSWVDEKAGIALGHRRLSIIDLSQAGHQPMVSACGRFVIVFNGEVYNFKELRKEFVEQGNSFRGHSDTEVMLAAISCYGLEKAVQKFNGMFAFAVWDRKDRVLSLIRDRFGEKPLYYGWAGNTFLFASELKAFRAYPEFTPEIDRDALSLYMRYNCIPAPRAIYRNVFKLLPATILRIDASIKIRQDTLPVPYWSLLEAVKTGKKDPFSGSEKEAQEALDDLLSDAVKLRMESDVALGVFLSGGLDSSLVTTLMQRQSSSAIKTFTIGVNEAAYNEAAQAKAVAHYLGTEHTEFYVTVDDAMAVVPGLADMYDEPFSDSSQIPTHLVSQLTRSKVTVSLSGDGGDEIFAGYNRYFWVKDIWRNIGWLPYQTREMLSRMVLALSADRWESFLSRMSMLLPKKARLRTPGDKMHKLADVLSLRCPYDMYLGLVSHWREPQRLVRNAQEPSTIITDSSSRMPWLDLTEEMMYKDSLSYLPDDILVKVDRASMSVGLESRAPYLDHRVAEFAWRLPLGMKMQNKRSKMILRSLLAQYIPSHLVERPKMGFALPIDAWLRGPLKDWAQSLLDESKIRQAGFLNYSLVQEKLTEHLSGKRNWQYLLWDVLMFQAWYERWK